MCEEVNFVDILEPRRTQSGIFCFMSRNWHPQKPLVMEKYISTTDIKTIVANSIYLESVIEAESVRSGVCKQKLRQDMLNYLKEIGLDKKLHMIRWLGMVFLKICFMMKIKLFVNENAVLKLKSTMGKNPVLFLPTHRSYADFCLMTYLSYHYDIEFPAVAAGMDFYSMAFVGRLLQESCAFYIRRTLAGDPLYAATLKQYVRTLVAKYSAPVEFFLEGTRSRSNKTMPPKFGMLSMSLMPLFAREVNDITIVPVNISYDRLMEDGLFAYEHIGVPKPKESTGGLLKALRSLNDHFGDIYINLGSPISVKEYFKGIKNSKETLKPIDLQQLTDEQYKQVQDLAEYVMTLQQKNTVATVTNLLAFVLMQSIIKDKVLAFDEVLEETVWMVQMLKNLGASVFENDVKGSIEKILLVQRQMMQLDKDRKLRLVCGDVMDVTKEVKAKMKGHILDAETMAVAVPVIQLQLYVNPILHYFVPAAIVILIVQRGEVTRDILASDYCRLRKLLSHEFFYMEKCEDDTFSNAVQYCKDYKVVTCHGDMFRVNGDTKLHFLLRWTVWPALTTLYKCIEVMTEQVKCTHKSALKLIQQRVESSRVHPYCLSLEAISNCLRGLLASGALVKDKGQQELAYQLIPHAMAECRRLVISVLPSFSVEFGRANSVVLDQRAKSRL